MRQVYLFDQEVRNECGRALEVPARRIAAAAVFKQSAAGVAAPAGAPELSYPAKITLDQDWIGVAGHHSKALVLLSYVL